MSAFCRKPVVCALLLFGLFSGCKSPRSLHYPDSSAAPDDSALAEALANFGIGVLLNGLGQTNALVNFERSAELAPDNVRVSFRLALQYVAAGQGEKALQVMENACSRNPDSSEAYLLLAHVANNLQSTDKALWALQRAVEIAPYQSVAHLQLAMFYAGRQEENMVLSVLENALPQVDDPLPIWRVLGDLYAAQVEMTSDTQESRRTEVLRRAIECYEQAGNFPMDALWTDYQGKLGALLLLDQRYDQAARIFEELIKRRPDDKSLHKQLALCLFAANRRDDALRQLNRISDMFPDDADIFYFIGEMYEQVGDISSAIDVFTGAIKADPTSAASYVKLALLLAPRDLQRAIAVLQDGAARLPRDLAVRDLLARLYLRARRGPEAMRIFQMLQRQFEDKAPESITPQFWMGYAAAAQQSGNPRQAVRFYEKALKLNPRLIDAYVGLSLLHLSQTNSVRALSVINKSLEEMPENPEAHRMAGFVYSQAGDFEDACKAFECAGELARESGDASALDADYYFHFGAACEREKKYSQAEKLLLKALNLDSDHADAANYLAYMLAEQERDLMLALALVEHALELNPETGAYLDTLGWVYFKLGRREEAEDEILNALRIMPDDPAVMEHYGDALARRGDLSAALEWWMKSWRRNPENQELKDKLLRHGIPPSDMGEAAPGGD